MLFFSFDLGDRLGKLICDKDVWWDYANEQIAEVSFNNVIEAIEIVLLPWFEEMENLESIRKELTTQKKKREGHGGRLSDTQAFWLDAIEKDTWDEAIVLSNIETFKLAKKLS